MSIKIRKRDDLKYSGVDWIDKIAVNQQILPLKRLVKIKITDGPHTTPEILDSGIPFLSAQSVQSNNVLDFEQKRGFISEYDHGVFSKKCRPIKNDIFLVKSGATTGRVAMVETDEEFSIWSPLALIRADKRKILSKYLFYFLQSELFQKQVRLSWSYGTQENIGMGVIEMLGVPFPEVDKQLQVVAFLDKKTAIIDEVVKKKKKQIELLKERRAAIISHATTKGTDPNVKMKDSGIEWISEIPEEWEMKKLKNIGYFSKGGNISKKELTDEGVPVLLYGDIYTKYDIQTSKLVRRTDIETAKNSSKIFSDDLLFTGSGETVEDIGRCVGYFGEDIAYAGGDVIIFRQNQENSKFLAYQQNGELLKIEKAKLGKGQIIVHIYSSQLKNISVPIPPRVTQDKIVKYLDETTEIIDEAMKKIQKSVELIQEYRSSLISHAVTGKIVIE